MSTRANPRFSALFNFLSISTYFLLSIFVVSASVLKVENGVYKRITVKVNDDVSKCHCDQVIENLQVGNISVLITKYQKISIDVV